MYLLWYIYMLDITRGSGKRLSLNFNNKKKKNKIILDSIQKQSERQQIDTMWEKEKEGDSYNLYNKQ